MKLILNLHLLTSQPILFIKNKQTKVLLIQLLNLCKKKKKKKKKNLLNDFFWSSNKVLNLSKQATINHKHVQLHNRLNCFFFFFVDDLIIRGGNI